MWKPIERIRWQPSAGPVPTAAEAASSILFSPIDLGPLALRQRSWIPAMVPWRATADGFVSDDVVAWYTRFARGRVGAIVVEATGIRDVPSGPLLRIGHDRFIPGLQKLVRAVHDASEGQTRVLIQLIDFLAIRRRPDPNMFLSRFLTITTEHRRILSCLTCSEEEVRQRLAALSREKLLGVLSAAEVEALDMGARERVTDLQLSHIEDLPARLPPLFADAAGRARQAGFDGVELHYAHAYTMASFLSVTNDRPDGWGGTRENRVRLPLDVYRAVRKKVGQDFAVGCRFLADECIGGGSGLEDSCFFATEFARMGMDFLSTSRGGKFDDALQPPVGGAAYPYTGPSGYECMPHHLSDTKGPFGRNAQATATIRATLRAEGLTTPIVHSGGVHNFAMAERLLADGTCDVVGAARQSLADPDWWLKLASGNGHSVQLCRFSNYCEGLDQKHKMVTCQLWDREGLHLPDARLDREGRRRLEAPPWNAATSASLTARDPTHSAEV